MSVRDVTSPGLIRLPAIKASRENIRCDRIIVQRVSCDLVGRSVDRSEALTPQALSDLFVANAMAALFQMLNNSWPVATLAALFVNAGHLPIQRGIGNYSLAAGSGAPLAIS